MKLLSIAATSLLAINAHAEFMTGNVEIRSNDKGESIYSCHIKNNGFSSLQIQSVTYSFMCNSDTAKAVDVSENCTANCEIKAHRSAKLDGPLVCEQGTIYQVECGVEYSSSIQ
ncbi:MAG: hypothetical protein KDD37_07830 [Bdellovibrionales bacterium]|nr:hypothetical protein [Bdellovibrionales bacterium]